MLDFSETVSMSRIIFRNFADEMFEFNDFLVFSNLFVLLSSFANFLSISALVGFLTSSLRSHLPRSYRAITHQ